MNKTELYKTELCNSWKRTGTCRYGHKCLFAHGRHEIQELPPRPKNYKTHPCTAFALYGSCPYKDRCCFLHAKRLPVFVFITDAGTLPAVDITEENALAPFKSPFTLKNKIPV